MSAVLTVEQLAAALQRDFGLDRETAMRRAEAASRVNAIVVAAPPGCSAARLRVQPGRIVPVAPDAPRIPEGGTCPVSLTLEWDALCPDNRKYGGMIAGRIWTTPRYRAAKGAAHRTALAAMGARHPMAGPVAIEARVYFPDDRGDAPNLAKCAHDAFQGAVYWTDSQVHDARWRRAGTDPAHPRAEITITSIGAPTGVEP